MLDRFGRHLRSLRHVVKFECEFIEAWPCAELAQVSLLRPGISGQVGQSLCERRFPRHGRKLRDAAGWGLTRLGQ
jgi:hypothetical protein